MSHIDSIGAGLYSDLSVSVEATLDLNALPASEAAWKALFANEVANGVAVGAPAGEFRRVTNIREFPQMGTPPNIISVPVYGSKTSRQVQGQADAPTFEVTLNFVPLDWQDAANYLGDLVGNGNSYAFRFALMNALPTGTGVTQYASTAPGIGTVKNSQWYWGGKFEALQIAPSLSDSNTAVLTISIQTDFLGAYTI